MKTPNEVSLLTLSELLSRSYQEIKNRFAPFFLLACFGPAFNWLLMGLLFGFNPITQSAMQQQYPFRVLVAAIGSMLAGTFFLTALVLFVCKRSPSPLQALKDSWPRFWRVVWGSFLLILALSIVLLLAALAGAAVLYAVGFTPEILAIALALYFMVAMVIWAIVMVYMALFPYPLILSEQGVLGSLYTSFRLVKGYFWKTLGLLLVLTIISSAISLAAAAALWLVTFIVTLALPQLAWIFGILWIPVLALIMLVVQIPLIALYLDRSSAGVLTEQTDNKPSLEAAEQ